MFGRAIKYMLQKDPWLLPDGIEEILPVKIELNMKFINNPSTTEYFKIIILTLLATYNLVPEQFVQVK